MVLDIIYIDDTHVQLIGNRPLCASLPAFPVDNCLPSFIIVWSVRVNKYQSQVALTFL